MENNDKNREYQVFYAYKGGEYIRKKLIKEDKDLKCNKYSYIQLKDKDKKLLVCITKNGNKIKSIPIALLIHKDDPDAKYIMKRFKIVFIEKEPKNYFLPEKSNIF